jgi:hypothetical protein
LRAVLDSEKRGTRLFYAGAPLAIVPALAFLPAVAYLVVEPKVPHAKLIAWCVFPLMAAAEIFGVQKLAIGCVERPFGLSNVLSFGALLVLVMIMVSVGFFLAMFAGGMS